MIITIDGTSGTGKSTVAKEVARSLGLLHFDTGAMYRAVTWGLIERKIPFDQKEKIENYLAQFSFEIRVVEKANRYFVGEVDVTEKIRLPHITSSVSEVSAMPYVREHLWRMQKKYGKIQGAVFEGRDMGSAVFPQAELKIFLDANLQVRAKRRLEELRMTQPKEARALDQSFMESEILKRDEYDKTRLLAPLKCPKDAHVIDTSNMSIAEVQGKIIGLYKKRLRRLVPGWRYAKKMGLLYRCILCFIWCLFRIFYRHRVYGLQNVTQDAAIIAPNHTSFWDPPAAAISWPQEVHFLARESLFKPFLLGPLIRALNAHPVSGNAGDVSVFKTLLELLKGGKQIVLFPEGTRSYGKLKTIKPGIGMLAVRSKALIIPTYIDGMKEIWGRKRAFPKLRGKTACVFGTPIDPEDFSHLGKKEGQYAIASRLREALLSLEVWYKKGAKGLPP